VFDAAAHQNQSASSDTTQADLKDELKTAMEQALSAVQATKTSDTNPFAALSLIVDPRLSDAIRLGEGNFDRDGWLAFTQQKTGGEVAIPFRRALPEFAEGLADDLAQLHGASHSRNERHLTFLQTQAGASRSPKSVSQWFAAKARKAGIEGRTAHGLRKSHAIALAEAGAPLRRS
jgi:integrase